ncbi:MAG: NTE family protein [Candidatus Krumholzibacteriia bacterium]|jgi:NTE family protein
MKLFHRAIVLTFLVLTPLATATDLAQAEVKSEADSPPRPRIGLVLGGGGARGGAHVGVLQVLHEMRIPIDLVAGTSMGSVVGALHSIGMTPDEIEGSVREVDWDDLFSDRPTRTNRSFRRKQDDNARFLPIEWGWKGRIVLPSGAIAGQKLAFAFPNPSLYLFGHDSFDNLSTPFRPVTTDLQTGKMYVPDRGNLMKAVRASMSIPGVFPPVHWDGQLLVDGFMARNLPVDVAKEMGAEIIIAVDVGSLPEDTPEESLHTMGGITEQQGIVGSRQNVDPMLALADLVIQPDLKISTREFKRITESFAPGRKATLAIAEQLQKYSLSEAEYAAHLQKHRPREIPPLIISEIELTNLSIADDEAILVQVRQPLNEELNLARLKEDLAEIYDMGVFELVDFKLKPNDKHLTLSIVATPRYYAPNTLFFGFSYSGGDDDQSDFNMRVRWTRFELNRLGGELRTDLIAGRPTALRSEWYQPLRMDRIPFVALTANASNELNPWYFQSRKWGEYRVKKLEGQFDVGLRLGHVGEIRAGVLYGHLNSSDRTGLSLAEFNGRRGGYVASLGFDMVDLPVLPRHGWKAGFNYFRGDPEFGSDLDYRRLSAAIGIAHTFGRHTFHLTAKAGTSLNTNMPEFDLFTLGGLARLSGLNRDQLRGDDFGLGTLAWYTRLSSAASPYATTWHLAVQYETGNTWYNVENPALDSLEHAGLIGLVGTTFAGPFSIAYGRTAKGNDALYVTLGVFANFLE